jgi:phenylalanyl-tRNA synthetase beta chain
MGGADSAVSDETQSIILESAFFAPTAIAGRARAYGLHTDASHRFERGVDPALCRTAIERATALLLAIAGGQPGPVSEACEAEYLPARPAVSVRPDRVNAVLGTTIATDQMRSILSRLGMPPSDQGEAWQVTPPSWRFDIRREVDLIEEIARIYGYNRLPSRRTSAPAQVPRQSERSLATQRLRALLVDRGYQEALTYSFVSEDLQTQLDPDSTPLALANPLSADLAVMRTTLWTGLVRALQYNRNRQIKRVRLFETGLRFRANTARSVDFFDVKHDVEALLALGGGLSDYAFVAAAHPALHPGQSAQIVHHGETIGWLGALHPSVLRALDLDGPVYVFELERSVFDARPLPAFAGLSRFPSIRRDLAVVVDEAVSAESIQDCIKRSAGEHLDSVVLFDVYRGQGVSDGFKSLAIGLILQDNNRTLTDEEVDAVQQRVVATLREALGAELRE